MVGRELIRLFYLFFFFLEKKFFGKMVKKKKECKWIFSIANIRLFP